MDGIQIIPIQGKFAKNYLRKQRNYFVKRIMIGAL